MSSLHLDLQTFPSFYYTQRVTRTSLSKRKSNFRTDLIIEMCKISTPLPKLDRTSFIRKSMNLQTSFKNYQNIKNIYNNNSNFSFSSFFKSYIYFFTLKKKISRIWKYSKTYYHVNAVMRIRGVHNSVIIPLKNRANDTY